MDTPSHTITLDRFANWFLAGSLGLAGIVAAVRNHHQGGAIIVLNLFLGWTVLGWIMALVWASTAVKTQGKPAA